MNTLAPRDLKTSIHSTSFTLLSTSGKVWPFEQTANLFVFLTSPLTSSSFGLLKTTFRWLVAVSQGSSTKETESGILSGWYLGRLHERRHCLWFVNRLTPVLVILWLDCWAPCSSLFLFLCLVFFFSKSERTYTDSYSFSFVLSLTCLYVAFVLTKSSLSSCLLPVYWLCQWSFRAGLLK